MKIPNGTVSIRPRKKAPVISGFERIAQATVCVPSAGTVGVISNFGENAREEPWKVYAPLQSIRNGIPKKIAAIHYCYDNVLMKPFVSIMQGLMSKSLRIRFRTHFGDLSKLRFELQCHGIPTEHHPILATGVLSVEWHHEWLEVRRTQEESESSKDGTIIPRRFGKKESAEHIGTQRNETAHFPCFQFKTAFSEEAPILENTLEIYERLILWKCTKRSMKRRARCKRPLLQKESSRSFMNLVADS